MKKLIGLSCGLLAGAYSVYATCAFISLFLVLKCVRETKGIELEDMKG